MSDLPLDWLRESAKAWLERYWQPVDACDAANSVLVAVEAAEAAKAEGAAEERARIVAFLNDVWPELTRQGRGHEAHTVCTLAQRIERSEHEVKP